MSVTYLVGREVNSLDVESFILCLIPSSDQCKELLASVDLEPMEGQNYGLAIAAAVAFLAFQREHHKDGAHAVEHYASSTLTEYEAEVFQKMISLQM